MVRGDFGFRRLLVGVGFGVWGMDPAAGFQRQLRESPEGLKGLKPNANAPVLCLHLLEGASQ